MSEWPKIILFGDSITQYAFSDGGWGASLANKLQRKCDVLNRGFSGYNTTWAKYLIPKIVPKTIILDVVLVTIFFGANDAVLTGQSQKHVPLNDYRQNTKEMVDYLTNIGIDKEKIVLISPPPLDDKAWGSGCVSSGSEVNRKNEVTGKYSEMCCSVAKQCEVDCIDLWSSMQQEKNWERFLIDGLHLSIEGSRFLEKNLSALVLKKTSKLPVLFPDWKDINPDHPEDSLF
ncbi:isoamyl acetate-hydrolyzing esterase 1 homolog [Antedon mediterranea]|uniref:isoamyl acetate-hydrolyzing esterase 1 homolog n=1 Tax=Antedon mediterranea TaxID=105859 RepID=UPI003AF6FC9B